MELTLAHTNLLGNARATKAKWMSVPDGTSADKLHWVQDSEPIQQHWLIALMDFHKPESG